MDGNVRLLDWYWEMPAVTRLYFTGTFTATVLCAFDVVSPYSLYYNYRQIARGEYWRLVTNFLFFGNLGIDFLFHMYFLVRYCQSLEEGSFRNKPADFLWFLVFGMIIFMAIAPWVNVMFFGSSLTFMMVYLWSKRNPAMQIGLFGLLAFSAPYLPWALLGFSLLLGHDVTSDVLGIAVGHIYYYLADVLPAVAAARGWYIRKFMRTPFFLPWLFGSCRRTAGGANLLVVNRPVVQPAHNAPAQAAAVGGGAGGGGGGGDADPVNVIAPPAGVA